MNFLPISNFQGIFDINMESDVESGHAMAFMEISRAALQTKH